MGRGLGTAERSLASSVESQRQIYSPTSNFYRLFFPSAVIQQQLRYLTKSPL